MYRRDAALEEPRVAVSDSGPRASPASAVRGGAAASSSGLCGKMVEEGSLRVVRCGGSELNFRRAVFSADSKYGATALVCGPRGVSESWDAGQELSGVWASPVSTKGRGAGAGACVQRGVTNPAVPCGRRFGRDPRSRSVLPARVD